MANWGVTTGDESRNSSTFFRRRQESCSLARTIIRPEGSVLRKRTAANSWFWYRIEPLSHHPAATRCHQQSLLTASSSCVFLSFNVFWVPQHSSNDYIHDRGVDEKPLRDLIGTEIIVQSLCHRVILVEEILFSLSLASWYSIHLSGF